MDLSLEQIPKLGPIRARALRKAGWDSIESLSRATVQELAAVRGMTEIKARQLFDFLHSMGEATDATGPVAPAAVEAVVIAVAPAPPVEAAMVEVESSVPDEKPGVRALHASVLETGLLAKTALRLDGGGALERALSRQLSRIVDMSVEWPSNPKLGPKRCERAEAQLRKIREALLAADVGTLGKKAQERLAEELRDRRRRAREVLED
jgi:hypothetical protein